MWVLPDQTAAATKQQAQQLDSVETSIETYMQMQCNRYCLLKKLKLSKHVWITKIVVNFILCVASINRSAEENWPTHSMLPAYDFYSKYTNKILKTATLLVFM